MTTDQLQVHPDTGEPIEDIAHRLYQARVTLERLKAEVNAAVEAEATAEQELLDAIPPGGATPAGPWVATTVTESRGRRQINRQACETHQDALLRAGAATCETRQVWTYMTVRDLDDPKVQACIQAAGVTITDLVLKPTERYRIELIPTGSVDTEEAQS